MVNQCAADIAATAGKRFQSVRGVDGCQWPLCGDSDAAVRGSAARVTSTGLNRGMELAVERLGFHLLEGPGVERRDLSNDDPGRRQRRSVYYGRSFGGSTSPNSSKPAALSSVIRSSGCSAGSGAPWVVLDERVAAHTSHRCGLRPCPSSLFDRLRVELGDPLPIHAA